MHRIVIDELIESDAFAYPRTQAIEKTAQATSYFENLSKKKWVCAKGQLYDVLVLDLVCDGIPDENSLGLLYREKIGIVVGSSEQTVPAVCSLRADFPILPHTNESQDGLPESLCLYAEPPKAVLRTWTPISFLRRIYNWFESSSKGELHATDQPLEHFFFSTPYELILPKDFGESVKAGPEAKLICTNMIQRKNGGITFILKKDDGRLRPGEDQGRQYHIFSLETPSITSGKIWSNPLTLNELKEKLSFQGYDFFEDLKSKICSFVPEGKGIDKSSIDDSWTILLIQIPIKRTETDSVEKVQIKAYILMCPPTEIGLSESWLVQQPDSKDIFRNIDNLPETPGEIRKKEVFPLEVLRFNQAKDFSIQSGLEINREPYVMIGLGTLGSALFDLFDRSGWGKWLLIDNDHIRPHNITRHTAGVEVTGINKAEACKLRSEFITTGNQEGISFEQFDAVTKLNRLKEISCNRQLIVDATANIDYPRAASIESELPRHCSVFLTPNGGSSVFMLEDRTRNIPLLSIEAQYYRAILNSSWGAEHLVNNLGKYYSGASCRDISVRLSYSKVLKQSAVLFEQISDGITQDDPCLVINTSTPNKGLEVTEVPVNKTYTQTVKLGDREFTIYIDEGLIEKLRNIRSQKLPSETGGMLFGFIDLNISAIVIVDGSPEPLGSESSSTHYLRGNIGTLEYRESVLTRTANIVDYIGEWHSHPKDVSAEPSDHDFVQLIELTGMLAEDERPALQLIVSGDDYGIQIGQVIGNEKVSKDDL